MDRASFIEHDGRPAVQFRRTYPHPIQRVWAAISEPAQIEKWFPSKVSFEPRTGASIEFSGDQNTEGSSGTILAFAPPRLLAFNWGGDELHFELEPIDDASCMLTLINVLEAHDTAARNAAGWTVCLAELDKLIAGQNVSGPHSDSAEDWREHYDSYVAAGMPSGAELLADGAR